METIIVNPDHLSTCDQTLQKARCLVFDEENKIYLCVMNGNYMLPGGTHEPGEDPFDTVQRELYEEMGLSSIEVTPLVEVHYYHKKFPQYGNPSHLEKRLNIVYYFIAHISSQQIGPSHLTKMEQDNHMVLKKYSIEQTLNNLKNRSNNPYSRPLNVELKTILNYYLKHLRQ